MGHWKRCLRLLGSHRLWCQGLLRHHGSPSRVAHTPSVMGLDLGLAGQLHWLLWQVLYRRLSRVGVMLWV